MATSAATTVLDWQSIEIEFKITSFCNAENVRNLIAKVKVKSQIPNKQRRQKVF